MASEPAGAGAGRTAAEAPADGAAAADASVAGALTAVDSSGVGARLLGPAEVRALAAELGMRPTKRLGQNFVHDANTVRRIVRAADLAPDDVVLEVGPGLGSLTLGLLEAAAAVCAVEIDPVLAQRLPTTALERAPALAGRLDVVTADALRVRAADLPAAPTALVANLPYNVGVPVVLHLLAELPSLRRGLVMVQAEVAERLAAAPGSKVYGVPSAKLAWFAVGPPGRAGAAGGVLAGAERRLGPAGVHPPRPSAGRPRRGVRAGGRRVRPAPEGVAVGAGELGGFAGRGGGGVARGGDRPDGARRAAVDHRLRPPRARPDRN